MATLPGPVKFDWVFDYMEKGELATMTSAVFLISKGDVKKKYIERGS